MSAAGDPDILKPFFADHKRSWRDNLYVYPVISRRSGGLSIGVNLNPDKACNFDCVYCQVDRATPPAVRKVDLAVLRAELEAMLRLAVSGELFDDSMLRHVPEAYRRPHDIAFSGDGEPTASPQFPAAVRYAAELKQQLKLDDVKLIVITDAAYLQRPAVREALAFMDEHNGETWAKLDAGTEEHFRAVNRPNVGLQTVLDNILDAARVRPIVIQSLWMNLHGRPPADAEVDAFAGRLRDIIAGGGTIRLVQVYTTARRTAEAYVSPLSDEALDAVARRIAAIVDVPIERYGA